MKTTPMGHQTIGLELLKQNPDSFMLACEQGTGKTWMELADAEWQIAEGLAEALFVIAPKGVHTNWVLREIPIHVSIPVRAAFYSSGASMAKKREVDKLFRNRQPGELIVLSMNIDAINSKPGYAMAAQFLKAYQCIMVVDESSRIKTPTSLRTKKVVKLGSLAVSRRCLSGTPITNTPGDIFSQFEFLAPGQALLGTTSYRAFVAEYAELLPPNHHLMKHITKKIHPKLIKLAQDNAERRLKKIEEEEYQQIMAEPPVTYAGDEYLSLDANAEWAAERRKKRLNELLDEELAPFLPQMPKRDRKGFPIYRNLEKLSALLKPKMYRVLKKDCMDLPPKVYKTLSYDLNPAQQKVYDQAKEKLRLEFGEEIDIYSPLTLQTKLQQIASGFILRDGDVTKISEAIGTEDTTTAELIAADQNPRIELLQTIIEDTEGSFIIWARYRQEIVQISALLKSMGIEFMEYHGGTKQADRDKAIDALQSFEIQSILANQQSGGIGITMTAAITAIYYSQSCQAEVRWQSEDRNHRKGTTESVLYIDIVANGTIDEKITHNLQSKERMAHSILDEVY